MIVLMSVSPARMKSRMNAVPTATMRERDRDRGRDERAEDDQQHDERGEEAEQLLCALLDRRELGVAVELGGDARRFDRLANSVLHGDDPRSIRRLDDVRELRLRVGDPAVRRRSVCSENGSPTLSIADLVLGRRELGRLELRDRVLDRGLALGRVEPLALGRGEDEVEHRALLGGELRLDEVGRLCVSEPGISNSSLRLPPTVATSTMRTAMIPSQREDDRHVWLAHARIQRARPPVDSRSCAARCCCCSDMLKPPSCRCGYDPPSSRISSVELDGAASPTFYAIRARVRACRPLSSRAFARV